MFLFYHEEHEGLEDFFFIIFMSFMVNMLYPGFPRLHFLPFFTIRIRLQCDLSCLTNWII